MKKAYQSPKLEIENLEVQDILCSSAPSVSITSETMPNVTGDTPPVAYADLNS